MNILAKEINLDNDFGVLDEFIIHSGQVALLMGDFARFLKLDSQMEDDCTLAGYFHDIGKILVDKKFLKKKGKLEPKEFREIMKHVDYSNAMTKTILSNDAWLGVSDHHEDFDGGGYPSGKKGEAISYIGRMLRVVDMYVALRTKRSYKEPFTYSKTIEIMKKSINKFDPILINAFFDFLSIKHEEKYFHYKDVEKKKINDIIKLTGI